MSYNLCIIKPNNNVFSETFVQTHIDFLEGNKTVLYGGDFPVYKSDGTFLLRSKLDILIYLIQKRIFKRKDISVRNKALVKYFEENKTDVVFTEYGTVGASVCKACEMANVPLVIHFHGADAHHKPTVAKYIDRYQLAFKYVSALICVSQSMVDELIRLGAPKEKIVLNPCGVDIHKFVASQTESTPPTFFFVGRFVEKKSPLTLIKAFAIVKKQVPEAHLIMAGAGALLEESKNLAQTLGLASSIEFPGVYTHQQVQEQMQKVRAFAQHSVTTADGDSEGTPVGVLEASASGLPVIATAHAGIKEAVIHQKTGLLSCEFDVEAFAQNMVIVLKDEEYAKSLGKNGVEHMRLNYSLKDKIAVIDQAIERAVNSRTKHRLN